MRTINQFPKRTDFYAALIRALNGLYEGVAFRFRYYGATTSQKATSSSAVFVEPGTWKIERLSRESAQRVESARIVCEGLSGSSEALARQIEEKTEFLDALRAHMNKPEESSEETKMNEEEQRKREESRREREDAEYDLEYRTASAAKKTKTSGVKLQDAKNALQNAKQSGDDKQIADATRQYMEALSRYESDKGALNRENESQAKEQERRREERKRQQQEQRGTERES